MKSIAKEIWVGYKLRDDHRQKGKRMKKLFVIAGFLISSITGTSQACFAADIPDHADGYYQIGEITNEITDIDGKPVFETEDFVPTNPTPAPTIAPTTGPQNTLPLPMPFPTNPNATPKPTALMIIDAAYKIWQIIKDGAPVVNVGSKNVSALPYASSGRWEALTGWKSERSIGYRISVKNLYGMETIAFTYRVNLLYGGHYGGKGKFIASARVIPSEIDVLWGYNLNVSVEVPTILNVAQPEDPNAAITLDVTYRVSTVLRSMSYTNTYELRGDGTMKDNGNTVIGPNACFLK